MNCEDVRNKLDLYVDSELPVDAMVDLETHMRDCAACASAGLARLKMKDMTRAAAVCYSPSPEFRARMERSIAASSRKRKWLPPAWHQGWAMAAAAAVLMVASVTFWVHRGADTDRQRAYAELADLHVATLASANPVDVVSTDRHNVKPWFAGKIPFSFDLPELQNTEFTLIGGRVVYFQHSPGAQLLFGVRKHRISAFIFQQDQNFDGRTFAGGESESTQLALHTETWTEGGLRYFLVSDVNPEDIHALGALLKGAAHP